MTIVFLLAVSAAAPAASDPWRPLYRPLKVPRIANGESCPVSRVDTSVDWKRLRIGPGIGPGPAYPGGLHLADARIDLAPARNFGSRDWMGQKVVWAVHPRYEGHVLIRGRQLDGRSRVRFGGGSLPQFEQRIEAHAPPSANGWRHSGAYTRVRAAGCYGYQVDGRTFSYVVVFRAVRPA